MTVKSWFDVYKANIVHYNLTELTVEVQISTSDSALDKIDQWFLDNPTISQQRAALGYPSA